jgi:hypothetical protein
VALVAAVVAWQVKSIDIPLIKDDALPVFGDKPSTLGEAETSLDDCIALWNDSANDIRDYLTVSAQPGDAVWMTTYEGPPHRNRYNAAIDDRHVATVRSGECLLVHGESNSVFAYVGDRWVFTPTLSPGIANDPLAEYVASAPANGNLRITSPSGEVAGP